MKAVGFYKGGSIDRDDALLDLEMPDPAVGARDLLVKIQAISVNPVDTKVRAGSRIANGKPVILGFDAAGTVIATGPLVTLFAPGDAVFYAGTITRPGTYAQLHTVDERIVGRKPETLGWAEAAALPLTSLTAWELLFDRLRAPNTREPSGQSILIINGAGGVGSILVQLARRLTSLHVIATASRPESIDWVKQMGAHQVIDHHKPLLEEFAGLGIDAVNYVASLAGSDRNLPVFANIIAPQGRLALIDDVKSFDIVGLRQKSISVSWEGVFTRSIYQTEDMIEQHRTLNRIAHLIDEGVLQSTFARNLGRIDAANLKAAHRLIESGEAFGKTTLTGFAPPYSQPPPLPE